MARTPKVGKNSSTKPVEKNKEKKMAKTSRRAKRPSLHEMGLDIREWRIQHGYTSKQLAEKLNVSNAATISSWENGKSSPRAAMLRKIRDLLGVPAGSDPIGMGRVIDLHVDGLQLGADGAITLVDKNRKLTLNLLIDGALRDYLGRLLEGDY